MQVDLSIRTLLAITQSAEKKHGRQPKNNFIHLTMYGKKNLEQSKIQDHRNRLL
jgi:hypothetical protein